MTEHIDTDELVIELRSGDRREQVRSQKAKALLELTGSSWKTLRTYPLLLNDNMTTVERGIFKSILESPVHAAFVRACPLTPRPGRLESSASTSVTDSVRTFTRIRDTMREIDPDGCMIVQPFIPAVASAVLAPRQYVVVGREHDGVTAGLEGQLLFPLNPNEDSYTYSFIDDENKHELEFVWNSTDKKVYHNMLENGAAYLTQIRACEEHDELGNCKVSVNGEGRFTGRFPKGWDDGACVASEILTVTGTSDADMAKLEATLEANENKTLVVCEQNGSLLTHAAAQSRHHGVVYVAGTTVKVGDTIDVLSSFDNSPYESHFMNGIEYARRAWQDNWGWLSTFFRQFIGDPFNDARICAFLGGCYVGWMINAGTAAIIGEVRHSRGNMQGYNPNIAAALANLIGYSNPPDGRQTYYGVLRETSAPYQDMLAVLEWAEHIYDHSWGGGSFGGKKWRLCTEAVKSLVVAVMNGDFNDIQNAADKTENQMHNTGWLYNKFIDKRALDYGTQGFQSYGTGINQIFGVYRLATSIIDAFKDSDYSISDVPERNTPSPSWESIVTLADDFDLAGSLTNLSNGWKEERAPNDSCPTGACPWCVSVQPEVREPRSEQERVEVGGVTLTIAQMSAMHYKDNPEGWFVDYQKEMDGEEIEQPDIPLYLSKQGFGWLCEEHGEEVALNIKAAVALMVEHSILEKASVAVINNVMLYYEGSNYLDAYSDALKKAGACIDNTIPYSATNVTEEWEHFMKMGEYSYLPFCGETYQNAYLWASENLTKSSWSKHFHIPSPDDLFYKIDSDTHHAFGDPVNSAMIEVKAKEVLKEYIGMKIPSLLMSKGWELTCPSAIVAWSAGHNYALETGYMDESLASHIIEFQDYIIDDAHRQYLIDLCESYGWDEQYNPPTYGEGAYINAIVNYIPKYAEMVNWHPSLVVEGEEE
tara:strand:- start:3589 stop:6387 length:2799 start_codon:yes stop_codon:yes gene_type:complete